MTESTAIEQPAGDVDSIGNDLAAAMEGLDEDFNELPEPGENEVQDGFEGDERDQDDAEGQGDESKDAEQGSDEADSEDTDEEKAGGDAPTLEPPQHWSAADKEMFAGAPKEMQEWALRRASETDRAFTEKTQALSDFSKTWEPVNELFAPHIEQLRAQGQSPASVISRWANIDRQLNENPQQTIQWLAQQYGIRDLSEEAPQVDPQIQAVMGELNNLRSQVAQREQSEVQQRLTSVQNDLTTFAEEKTEAGELAHPYFNDVYEDMVALAQADRASGKDPKVNDLYERAVWANPTVRENILASQRKAEALKAEQEAKAKAAKAKKATKTIKASGDGVSTSDLSLRDELSQAING